MKFKLDENMPADFAAFLRHEGHDAENVFQEGLAGAIDPPVLAAATREGRVLLTFDLDFADVRHYPPDSHSGIVVFRVRDQRWAALEKLAIQLLESGDLQALQNGLAIVDETRVRLRRPKKKGKS